MEFRFQKQKTLDKVTVEECGNANIKILQEWIKQNSWNDINSYLNYTADIYRLETKNVWDSVLLYDKEYRQKQSDESFEWGSYRQDLRDIQWWQNETMLECMHFWKRNLEHFSLDLAQQFDPICLGWFYLKICSRITV